MKRAIKKALGVVVAIALIVGIIPPVRSAAATTPTPEEIYIDWPAGAWCEEAFKWGTESNIIRGRTADRVEPWATAARSEFAALINRVFATYKPRDISQFADVGAPSTWYYPELEKSYQMRALQGTGATTFSPNDNVTREQAMTAVSRVLCLPLSDDIAALNCYTDLPEVSPWARPHVAAMVAAGIIVGTCGDKLSPKQDITRAELVQILRRVFYRFGDGRDEITGTHAETVIIRSAGVSIHDAVFKKDLIVANGVAESTLNLSNVTIKGRLLVWGGATVNVTGQSTVAAVTLPRNDNPVTVVFDHAATLLSSQVCVVTYPADLMAPENNVLFTDKSGGTYTPPPNPPTPPAGPEDVPLGKAVGIMYYDWDNTLLDVQYVNHSDVRQEVNEFVKRNFIHPELAKNKNVASLARPDNYRGEYPAEGPSGSHTVTDGAKYPLTNKLDYVFFKRVTNVADGAWAQEAGAAAYDTAYPYIQGWMYIEPTKILQDGMNKTYSVLGHTGEFADYNAHAKTTGTMEAVTLTKENDYLDIMDFSDIRGLEDSGNTIHVKAIYEPGKDLLGPDDGGNYTVTQNPQYIGVGTFSNSNFLSLCDISFEFSRFCEAEDGIHGVARIREPSIDFMNYVDMFRIGKHDHTNFFHSEMSADVEGETLFVSTSYGSDIHLIKYRLVDRYGTNFVVAPSRALDSDNQPAAAQILPNFACEAFVSLNPDGPLIGPEDEQLTRPEAVYGSNGFVFWGDYYGVLAHLTQYVLKNKPTPQSLGFYKDLNLRDKNGKFFETFAASIDNALQTMAQEAYQAHLDGNNEWWNTSTDTLAVSYHQMQHYVTDKTLLTNSEAEALVIPWCKLHDKCLAAGGGWK